MPAPAEVPEPTRHGGALRVHLDAEPTSLLPLAESDAAAAQVTNGLVYETLLDCRDGTYKPGLAESWDVSNDGMRLAVRVRSGVHWHDHRAFGVLDVQGTVEPLLRTGTDAPVLRAELADVASIELVTERTVRFVLKRPSDFALRALCDVPMLPDHLVHGVRPEASSIVRQPIGTGPFRFAGWDHGKRIRLERAPEYWGSPPGVDEIVFDLDPDAVRALNRTRRGEIDVLSRVIDAHYPDQVEPTTLHGGTTLLRLRSRRYSFLAVNHLHYPLSDPRFRKALTMLWARTRFAGELHNDLARPIGGPPLVDDLPAPPLDRPRAATALDDAGYRDSDADGVRDHLGHPIRLTLLEPAGNRQFHVEAHAFALEARKVGILVDLAAGRRGDHPAAVEARRVRSRAAHLGGDARRGSRAALRNGRGVQLRRLPLERARGADRRGAGAPSGPIARAPILDRIARLLSDEQPVIFLYRYDIPALASTRVHGLAAVGDRFDLRRVWLDP